MTVKELIEDIADFLKGEDQSLSPRLRRLHSAYAGFAAEIVAQQEECRQLASRLSLADAAAHARKMDPPLAARAAMLDFPEKERFVEICRMYQLPPIPEMDQEFLAKLAAPMNSSDRQTGALLQEWRRIARNGTTAKKMELLRKIVARMPNSNESWTRNLLELEKQRYREIAAELDKAKESPLGLREMEALNMELHSPLMRSRPPRELITALREQLLPLQEKAAAEALENCQDDMQACYAMHNTEELSSALRRWNDLITSPLSHPTIDQRQFAEDVRKYLEDEAQAHEKQLQYDKLLGELRDAMENTATPYAEVLALYNKLALLDLPLPQSLKEDVERLGDEHLESEHRLNVRRIAYGMIVAVAVMVLLFVGISLLHRRNSLRKSCANIAAFMDAKDFAGAIAFVESLEKEQPKLAATPEIMGLKTEAQDALERQAEERRLAIQEFQQLRDALQQLLQQDFIASEKDGVEERLARMEELREALDDEGRKELTAVTEEARNRRRHLLLQHEKEFLARRDALFDEMTSLAGTIKPGVDMAAADAARQRLLREIDALKAETTIDIGLRDVTAKQWQEKLDGLDFAMAEEKKNLELLARLQHPDSLESYLNALPETEDATDTRIRAYAQSRAQVQYWQDILSDLAEINANLATGSPLKQPKSHVGRNFVSILPTSLLNDLRIFAQAIQKNCDYYEIVATAQDGRKYFFFTKEAPLAERDKRNRKYLRYVSFDIDAYAAPLECAFSLMAEYDEKETPRFKDIMADKRRGTLLPETYIDLQGWRQTQKCEFFRLGQGCEAAITIDVVPEQLAINLLKEAVKIQHPICRYEAVMQLLTIIRQSSTLASAGLDKLLQELTDLHIDTSPWKQPDIAVRNATLNDTLDTAISDLKLESLVAQKELRWRFMAACFARGLAPAGVVYRDAAGTLAIHPFGSQKPTEFCHFSNEEFVIVKPNILPKEGELLWAFSDGKSCEKFMEEWREKALAVPATLEITPALCPMSLRYMLR